MLPRLWTLQQCCYAGMGGFAPGFARDNVCDGSFWRKAGVVGFAVVTWFDHKVLHSKGQYYGSGVRNVDWSPEFLSLHGGRGISSLSLSMTFRDFLSWMPLLTTTFQMNRPTQIVHCCNVNNCKHSSVSPFPPPSAYAQTLTSELKIYSSIISDISLLLSNEDWLMGYKEGLYKHLPSLHCNIRSGQQLQMLAFVSGVSLITSLNAIMVQGALSPPLGDISLGLSEMSQYRGLQGSKNGHAAVPAMLTGNARGFKPCWLYPGDKEWPPEAQCLLIITVGPFSYPLFAISDQILRGDRDIASSF